MREAIAKQDARSLARIAHSLKGSAAGLGARELAPACQQLETRARDGQLHDATELLANIELAYRNLVPVLDAQKNPATSGSRR